MTLGRMLSREEPSAGCSGRAESHTPLGSGSGSAIVGKYSYGVRPHVAER